MSDEFSFEAAGFETIGGRLFNPRPAAAATQAGRTAADYEREAEEHYAKADRLREESNEHKNAANVDGLLAIGFAPEGTIPLGLMAGYEKVSSDLASQQADREQKLAEQAKKQAEQARQEEEQRRQQASPFIHRDNNRGGDRDGRPHDVLKEGGVLPARGDLDHDHPSYRDPRALA
jgi:hypothetical protein